ncbi:MAG TPA: threonine ammonia-lyase [Gaiellaceae bacterium]|jgi:threonine dehydratase|nr:threonine ammonia-lyase [Gaiellaceae bacterium]
MAETGPGLPEIEQARTRLDGVARVTPVYRSATFSELAGRDVHLKAENLQRTGSFKVRGAFNRISTLSGTEREAGVVAASAGNHGQAVAWAAREVGARARIFMPQDAPMAKVDATRHYGAEIELSGATLEDALVGAQAYVAESGATFVHPYEDPLVIAGQGTIGLELAEQVPDAGTVVIPIGGGGLASGIAIALRARHPGVRIVGVQAAGTLPGGPGFTIADGVAVKKPGVLTSSILDRVLDDIVAVTDEEITESIVLILERTKLVVEGAGAVAVAALLHGKVGGEGPVVPLLSGGNIDATMLISVMRRGLAVAGRYLVLRTRVPDRPGELATLLTLLANERVNVVEVEHQRETIDVRAGETGVELTLLTRDAAHCDEIVAMLDRWGYPADRLS